MVGLLIIKMMQTYLQKKKTLFTKTYFNYLINLKKTHLSPSNPKKILG